MFGSGVPIEKQKFSLEDAYKAGKRLKKTLTGSGMEGEDDTGEETSGDEAQSSSGGRVCLPHMVKGSAEARAHMAKLRGMRKK